MPEIDVLPELKQLVGALLFGAKGPLTLAEIRRVLAEVAETQGGATKDFAKVSEAQLRSAMTDLKADLEAKHIGIHLTEVANGYRLQNDASCGPWLRSMLERGRPSRLSKPALETLAIIAYRQPCTRAEIEAVRGVAVDQIVRNLMDLQLIRIAGRSELPGRPWQFGTTQKFLEYFGINNVNDLPGIDELRRMEADQLRKKEQATVPVTAIETKEEEEVMSKVEQQSDDVVDNEAEEVEEKEDFADDEEDEDEEEEDEEEEDEDEDEEDDQ